MAAGWDAQLVCGVSTSKKPFFGLGCLGVGAVASFKAAFSNWLTHEIGSHNLLLYQEERFDFLLAFSSTLLPSCRNSHPSIPGEEHWGIFAPAQHSELRTKCSTPAAPCGFTSFAKMHENAKKTRKS